MREHVLKLDEQWKKAIDEGAKVELIRELVEGEPIDGWKTFHAK